jgi:hypothetical protein
MLAGCKKKTLHTTMKVKKKLKHISMQKIRWKFVCTQTSLSLHQVFFPPPQNTIIYMKKTRALPQPPNQTKIKQELDES